MSNSEPVAEAREEEEEEVYSSSDPIFWDYIRLKDFTKKTGIEEKDCHAFCAKELFDNAADIIEKWRLNTATITIDIKNDLDNSIMTISVSNPNPANKPVFGNLDQTFNYKRSFSSKSNQYKVTRGAQGDALKELGTIPYMLINSRSDDGEDKPWKHPLVFQHNKKIDKVYVEVDRKNRVIKPMIERSTCEDTDTKVTIALPTLTPKTYQSLLNYCRIYTLFNTHLSFRLFVDGEQHNNLPASLSMSEDYNNLNSIYCYSEVEFQDFLTDLYDKNIEVYNALTRSEFREINQPGRFEDLNNITIADLTTKKTNEIHKRLRKSMLAMSELPTPYKNIKTKRKEALVNRYRLMAPPSLQLEYDKAIYQRTKPEDTIYNNKTIRFPYSFEVLAIPIKKQTQEKSIIISGVNYSTLINNQSYFEADTYVYSWKNEKETWLNAYSIEGIIRVSSAGTELNYDDNIPSKKQRQPCVIIAHLVSPRPEYKHGYGKSTLKLGPYATRIAETIEEVVKRIPLRNRTKQSPLHKGPTGCLDELLQKRWDEVRRNPDILERFSPDYDPWTQSTVWYHLREEYLLPIERDYHETMIRDGTRKMITAMISRRCELLEGSPKREQLGIFAAPRATMYVNGRWYRVDIDDIPTLAGKGTDVIFIEKQGVVELIKHLEVYGIAFVNTQGHFADYPRDLVPRIVENGGNVVILTDFDCASIHIAERIIAADTTGKVKRLGIDMEILDYFIDKVENGEIKLGIKVKVRNENGELIEKLITTREELQKHIEEPYPKAEKGMGKQQQPGTNVVNAIIRYAKKYNETFDERYKYIYDNFEYLTGLDINVVDNLELFDDEFSREDKDRIDIALKNRDSDNAKRIELDSVIKVVRANLFSQFILDKLQDFFPGRDYTRAITLPKEYFADNFDILPEKTKQLFLYYAKAADKAVKPTDETIIEELEDWEPTDEEIEKEDKPILLKVPDENALNEMLRSKAVADDPEMQELDKKAGELLDSLPSLEEEDPDDADDTVVEDQNKGEAR